MADDNRLFWKIAHFILSVERWLSAFPRIYGSWTGKKQLDEFFEEDQRLYRNLSRLTTVIDDAEDDPGDEAEIHSYPEAHNGILEGLTATEWFTAGRQAASDRRWDDALNAFNKAIALNPENEEIYFHRGNVYDALGNNKKAVSNFNKAIKLNPLYVDAYLSRAFSYNNLAQANQALADIKKAARLGSLHAQKFLKKTTWHGKICPCGHVILRVVRILQTAFE